MRLNTVLNTMLNIVLNVLQTQSEPLDVDVHDNPTMECESLSEEDLTIDFGTINPVEEAVSEASLFFC